MKLNLLTEIVTMNSTYVISIYFNINITSDLSCKRLIRFIYLASA